MLVVYIFFCKSKKGINLKKTLCAGVLLGGIYLPSSGYNLLTTIQYNRSDSLLVFGQVSTHHAVHFNNVLKIVGLENSKELVSKLFEPSSFVAIVAIVQSIVNVYRFDFTPDNFCENLNKFYSSKH